MPKRIDLQNFRIETFLRLGLWVVLLSVVSYTRTDPDLWGHVRFGLDALRDHTLARVDPYSFTTDREWINHEWAAELFAAVAFTSAGALGLGLLKVLVLGITMVILERALLFEGILVGRRRDWIIAVAVITTVQQAHHVRPQLFSLLFFTCLLVCLLHASKGRKWLVCVPILFGLWTNFHGGWIVGGGVFILWLLGTAASQPSDLFGGVGAHLAVGMFSMAATLINPYGVGLWRFLWETVGFQRSDISEWQPVYSVDDPGIWALWLLTATLAITGYARGRHSLEIRRILIVGALGIGSLFVNRLMGFFGLSTALLFGAALIGSHAGIAADTNYARTRADRMAGSLVASLMIAGGLIWTVISLSCIRVDRRTTPDPTGLEVLKRQGPGGRLLVWFDWGEYAIWHLDQTMRVSIDGRRETVYSARLILRHLRFFFDVPGASHFVEEIGADYVWIPTSLPAVKRLKADGWTTLFEDSTSIVFKRSGSPGRSAAFSSVRSPADRCFPGP